MQPGGAELNVWLSGGRPDRVPAVPGARSAPGVTADQAAAAERCEALLRDTLDGVRPEPAWRHGVARAGARLPMPGAGPDDADVHWYVTRSRDIVTIVSAARRGALVGMVERHWRRCGWTVTSVNVGRELPGVAAVTPDGYQLALVFGDLGQAGLTAGSPGVARSEWVPYPHGVPVAPGGAPLPDVCCPFWSAMGAG
ncbi:hypothetical protein [Kitasatospora sp. NPDC088351]|uniref:hypothetical protein n=1 Tax=unclassified Kitasatospora TaxID=2633591 RepID=UPI00342EB8E2